MDYPEKVFVTLFLYDYIIKAPKKIVKKSQKLGSVTIFSYICSRIHKECDK